MTGRIVSHRDLDVYRVCFASAMRIYHLTRQFPREESYSLTDQIRRSSRSVCASIAEAWRRRRYRAVFVNKINEAEAEAAETQVWIEFAGGCGYLSVEDARELGDTYESAIRTLVGMITHLDSWVLPEPRP